MNHSIEEKRQWEKQAIEVFIDWFRTSGHLPLSFVSQNLPSKPDVTCMLGDEKVDIELAHLYGSQQDAIRILGKSVTNKMIDELEQMERQPSVEQRILHALNRILENKSHKHYDSENTWLVIRNAFPNWQCADFLHHLSRVCVPAHHPFKRIWLIGDLRAESGAIKLYPKHPECIVSQARRD